MTRRRPFSVNLCRPCTDPCSHIADTDGGSHHGECHSNHFSASCPEVICLDVIGIQSGSLVALHGIGNAHGLHKGFAHGIEHGFELTPHLGAGFFGELSSLLHCCKERTNVHASDGSLVAVVVLFGAFKRREGYAHALPMSAMDMVFSCSAACGLPCCCCMSISRKLSSDIMDIW